MRERTITYTGTGSDPREDRGAPQPGLVVVYEGEPRFPIGHPVPRARLIGRGDSADVVLHDPSVSRAHLVVEPAEGGFLVRDLGSHNGSFVDGSPLSRAERRVSWGAVIRVGKALLVARADVRAFDGNGAPFHPSLVGGPSLHRVRGAIDVAAASAATVLVEGETGAGKEVVARAIHEAARRTGELVEVNCAALPGELVESELFGHARGAFSGSDRARTGLFRAAHGGTLLLDEIGELPLGMQAKLLRVLETGQVRPVGEDRATMVDVRVIAATNRSLDAMVEAGTFRRDLLHRIAAARIALPPLRDRIEDVPILCRHFLEAGVPPPPQGMSIAAVAMELLLLHRWPGNTRELRNVVHAAAASARADGRSVIGIADVAGLLSRPATTTPPSAPADAREEEARARILQALAAAGGNVTQAARELGVARSGLYETIRRLRLDPTAFRARSG